MRAQRKGTPDAADRGLVDACGLCHHAGRPMRSRGRLALQRAHNDLFDLRITQFAGLSGTRFIQQSVQSLCSKPAPPFTDRLNTSMRLSGDGGSGQSLRRTQYNPCSHRKSLSSLSSARPALQSTALLPTQSQLRQSASASHDLAPVMLDAAPCFLFSQLTTQDANSPWLKCGFDSIQTGVEIV